MTAFDQLHPGLQHHIVNSLGWKELRPFQEEVIPVILRGNHVVVVAPTAGGKTEASALPVLSRMLSEDWRGLSVLYLCPIKALLNNLHIRLSRYATLVGRTCSVWHGDISPTGRDRIKRDRPDILLTTPESLEGVAKLTQWRLVTAAGGGLPSGWVVPGCGRRIGHSLASMLTRNVQPNFRSKQC